MYTYPFEDVSVSSNFWKLIVFAAAQVRKQREARPENTPSSKRLKLWRDPLDLMFS